MLHIERLRVSLTKNGYLKIADLVRRHSRWEVLDNAEGAHPGINIKRSQISNIMSADPITGQLPEFWDRIKRFGNDAIDSFTLVAVILSHERLIHTLRRASRGNMRGRLRRQDLTTKEYTNLVYAVASLGLCEYVKGAEVVAYDFYRLIYNLRGARRLLRQLIESKLERCGWLDPARYPHSADGDFSVACRSLGIPALFGLEPEQFQAWVEGDLEMADPARESAVSIHLPR